MLEPDYDYSQEAEIVWLRGPLQFHYLRESSSRMNFRSRPPSKAHPLVREPNVLVGYVNLKATAKTDNPGRFARRYWWLMHRDLGDTKGWKAEAVDPRSIRVGHPSSYRPLEMEEPSNSVFHWADAQGRPVCGQTDVDYIAVTDGSHVTCEACRAAVGRRGVKNLRSITDAPSMQK